MAKYLVFLATETVEVEADMVRMSNAYFSKVEGQQPTICFYRGFNATRDHVVAEFVYKNISGYCLADGVKRLYPVKVGI
jgi:hypothetical protein